MTEKHRNQILLDNLRSQIWIEEAVMESLHVRNHTPEGDLQSYISRIKIKELTRQCNVISDSLSIDFMRPRGKRDS